MTYSLLTVDHQVQLRQERLLALEADHCRALMALDEIGPDAPERDALQREADEFERRAIVHRSALIALTGPVVSAPSVDVPVAPAEPVGSALVVPESAARNGHTADAIHPH